MTPLSVSVWWVTRVGTQDAWEAKAEALAAGAPQLLA